MPWAIRSTTIVPSRTHRHGALWRAPLAPDRFEARLATSYRPYHARVAETLEAMRREHGHALLLDLHSMPPRAGQAQVVIGNRHGLSSASCLAEAAATIATELGFTAALNDPYAGGNIVERHGRPSEGIHALQVEIDRSAYLARDLMTPGAGFDRVSRLIEALATGLAEALAPQALAAE